MTADRSPAEIREALARYAAENKEGMASMAEQIGVEFKTLQRFANGTERLNDSFVAKIGAFLQAKGRLTTGSAQTP